MNLRFFGKIKDLNILLKKLIKLEEEIEKMEV